MKLFRITHNISAFLKAEERESTRYFSNIETACYIFNDLVEKIDYSKDEWISLCSVKVKNENGEFRMYESEQFRFFSDDTKIGVGFSPSDYNKDVINAICDSLSKWTSGNYKPSALYFDTISRGDEGNDISLAMDTGTNEDVKNAIRECLYARYRPTSEILHFLLNNIDIDWI